MIYLDRKLPSLGLPFNSQSRAWIKHGTLLVTSEVGEREDTVRFYSQQTDIQGSWNQYMLLAWINSLMIHPMRSCGIVWDLTALLIGNLD